MYPFVYLFGIPLPAYGIMLVVGCALCVLLSLRRCERYGCSRDSAIIILACAGGMAIIVAKLLYVVVSIPSADFLLAVKTGQLGAILAGGQVFYGGAIGGAVGAWLGLRIAGEKANPYLLAILPTIPLAHAAGRIGCFLAGCCFGVPYDGVFSAVYHSPVGGAPMGVPLFPVQCVEALCNILIFVVLMHRSRKTKSGIHLIVVYLGLYAFVRFVLEYYRYDAIRGSALLFSTSQWISIALAATAGILWAVTKKTRQAPGNQQG